MSRIAEAMQRAEHGAPIPLGDAAPGAITPANADMSAVPVPWEVQAGPAGRPAERLHAVERPSAPAPVDERSTEFVELVQRVFRPATGEPTARAVTLVSLGAAGSRRPIALEVGATLAGYGVGEVCVVDASFGAAALHAHAGVAAGPGLCDALLASRSAASLAMRLNGQLWLVPAGEDMCAAPGWLPDALARALRQVTARFDFVIVQAPPIEEVSGMSTLLTVAPLTDGVVLVLETERTRRDVANDVATRLRASGVSVLGAVLTSQVPGVASRPRRTP